jgi:hypothetical protein
VDPVIEMVTLAELKIDPDLQCRARGTQRDVVRQYADDMKRGDIFPAITVFRSGGGTFVANGFHRVAAALEAGITELQAEVKSGSKRDALLHSVKSDQTVGLRRTTLDKRRSVELVLAAFPKMSNLKLSQLVGVDDKTVKATRDRLAKSSEVPTPDSAEGSASSSEIPTPADPLPRLLASFRKLLGSVPADSRAAFTDRVLAIMSEATE